MAFLQPTPEVPLAQLARIALAVIGRDDVHVVTGAGGQLVQVPDSLASRVLAAAGLPGQPRAVAVLGSAAPDSFALEGTPAAPGAGGALPASGALPRPGPIPDPFAQTEKDSGQETAPPPEEPAARPPARPARRTKKTTARRTATRRKEE